MKNSLKIAALMVAAMAVTATATAAAETMTLKRQYAEGTGTVITVAETATGVISVSTREPLVAGYTGALGKNLAYRIRAEGEKGSDAEKYAHQMVGEFEPGKTSSN